MPSLSFTINTEQCFSLFHFSRKLELIQSNSSNFGSSKKNQREMSPNCGCPSGDVWITAAFRSPREFEVYMFMKKEFALVKYVPGAPKDVVLKGPCRTVDVFPSLKCTLFQDQGIDAAFASRECGMAFIFTTNQVAKFFFAPNGGCDRLVKGPEPVVSMFPFLKCSAFENGVDAAFESEIEFEAHLFKGNQYARINYNPCNPRLICKGNIKDHFPFVKCTSFENGIDAAYTSHIKNEAYFFKGDSYIRFKYTPGCTTNSHIIVGPAKIKSNWNPCGLGGILPRNANLQANQN